MANNDDTTVPIHKLPPRSKTKQPLEDHFDDCGDDISSILLPRSDDETKETQQAFHFDADPHDKTDTELHDNVLHATFDNNFTTLLPRVRLRRTTTTTNTTTCNHCY